MVMVRTRLEELIALPDWTMAGGRVLFFFFWRNTTTKAAEFRDAGRRAPGAADIVSLMRSMFLLVCFYRPFWSSSRTSLCCASHVVRTLLLQDCSRIARKSQRRRAAVAVADRRLQPRRGGSGPGSGLAA